MGFHAEMHRVKVCSEVMLQQHTHTEKKQKHQERREQELRVLHLLHELSLAPSTSEPLEACEDGRVKPVRRWAGEGERSSDRCGFSSAS